MADQSIASVSICICTWNRAELLDETLSELTTLILAPETTLEIVVVDNNSTDNTAGVIKKWEGRLPLVFLFESRPGQTWARNCAMRHAKGDLIVWTDDDVVPNPNWIANYVAAANEYPDAAFFGGTITPLFEVPPPVWLERNLAFLESPLVIRQLGPETRRLQPTECPFGANMAFRRTAVEGHEFDVNIGHRAGKMFGGDETQFIDGLRAAGHYGVWVGSARLQHFVPASRMTQDFLAQWCDDAGTGQARKCFGEVTPELFGVPRWCIRQYVKGEAALWWARLRGGENWVRPFMHQRRLKAMLAEWRRLRREIPAPTAAAASV